MGGVERWWMTKRCCWGKDAANLDLSEGPSAIVDLSKEIHQRSAVLLTSDVVGRIRMHVPSDLARTWSRRVQESSKP